MQTRGLWTTAALAGYALVIVISRQFSGFSSDTTPLAPWVYSAGYSVFGVLLLGAVARWWRTRSPLLWRLLMLSVGGARSGARNLDPAERRFRRYPSGSLDAGIAQLAGRRAAGAFDAERHDPPLAWRRPAFTRCLKLAII